MSTSLQKILIDSRLRSSGTISNFNIDFSNRGLHGAFALKAVNIFNSYHNVNANNNKFYFNDGTDQVITLTTGTYTINTLCLALQTALNALSALTFAVSFSSITYLVTISADSAFTIDNTQSSSIGTDLGLAESVLVSTADTIVGTHQIQFSALPMNYYISISGANDEIQLTNGNCFTFVVPITKSTQEQNYYEPSPNFCQTTSFSNECRNLKVRLLDHEGREIDMQNDYWLILEAIPTWTHC